MKDQPHICSDYVTATFSRDFLAAGFTDDAVERIHRSDIGDWIQALAWSGLFTNLVVANAANVWRRNPRALLDALLGDADEVTVRRYDAAWKALDDTVSNRSLAAVNE